MSPLSGRTALVTGAARGLGRATAVALAGAGAEVWIHFRASEAAARETAQAIASSGGSARLARGDLQQPGQVDEVFAAIRERGPLDILVNNIGDFLLKRAAETTWEEWSGVTRNNLDPMFLCARAALPAMRERGFGRIVNLTAAPAGQSAGAPRMGAYMAAKAAVLSFTRTLALEEAGAGITVNAVGPGIIDTEGAGPQVRAHPERFVPMGRLGRPEEVARAIVFLCLPESGYITGAHLTVDGGWRP